MNPLHLTKSQLAELREMGALGRHAAHELELWRGARDSEADHEWHQDEWLEGENNHPVSAVRSQFRTVVASCRVFDPLDGSEPLRKRVMRAVSYSRNTAELRAAGFYWEWQLWRLFVHSKKIVGVGYEEAKAKVQAISAALDEIEKH